MAEQDVELVPSSPFKSILNFRDVGQTINLLQKDVTLREGLLFRSARASSPPPSIFPAGKLTTPQPDEASPGDKNTLTNHHKIHSILDLRSKTEHLQKAKNSAYTTPTEIPSITYNYISLNGPSFERALLWRLSWLSLAKLLSCMALGYRLEGISILGREVMQPRGLTGLACDTLAHSTDELKAVFMLLADAGNFPLLVHCTQGKDRTGLVFVLVLMLLGVGVQAVAADYVASERELESERGKRVVEMGRVGLGGGFAGCPRGFVEDVVGEMEGRYGGVRRYLREKVGVGEEILGRIRKNLLVQ